MAYNGSTALSSVQNTPIQIARGVGGNANFGSSAATMGTGLWIYASTDTTTAPYGSGYFTDGYQLGMKQGDIMIVTGVTSTVSSSMTLYLGIVSSVSTTGGGTQLSTWGLISSTMA